MSFAGEVRRECAAITGRATHCQKAELRGIYEGCRHENPFKIRTESLTIQEKCISLVKKAYRLEPEVDLGGPERIVFMRTGGSRIEADLMNEQVLERDCCKRAYLRGMFLAAGTITNPNESYHLEIVARTEELADRIRELLCGYELEARITRRKNHPVLYIKEGQKVGDFLNIVGAHQALMEFENARIVREMRGQINRRVNCETANIGKTISASARQLADIRYIEETVGLGSLPENLQEIAKARLNYPDVSLQELGEKLEPPVGKSGVNHRLRKISEIAKTKREGERTHVE